MNKRLLKHQIPISVTWKFIVVNVFVLAILSMIFQPHSAEALPEWLVATDPALGALNHNYRQPITIDFNDINLANTSRIEVLNRYGIKVPIATQLAGTSVEVTTNYGDRQDIGFGANQLYTVEVKVPSSQCYETYKFYFKTDVCSVVENARFANNEIPYLSLPETATDLFNAVRDWSDSSAAASTPHSGICSEIGVICLADSSYPLDKPLEVPSCLELIGGGKDTTIRLKHPGDASPPPDEPNPEFWSVIVNKNHEKSGKHCGEDNEFINPGNTGITVRSIALIGSCRSEDPCDDEDVIEDWSDGVGQHGIGFYHVSNSVIIDSLINHTATDGIYLGSNSRGPSDRVIIAGNRIAQTYRGGVGITNGNENWIHGNQIRSIGIYGVNLENNKGRDANCNYNFEEGKAIFGNHILQNQISRIGNRNLPSGIPNPVKGRGIKMFAKHDNPLAGSNEFIGNEISEIEPLEQNWGEGILVNWNGSSVADSDLLIEDNTLSHARIIFRANYDGKKCDTVIEGAEIRNNRIEDGIIQFWQTKGCKDIVTKEKCCTAQHNIVTNNKFLMQDGSLGSVMNLNCALQDKAKFNLVKEEPSVHNQYCCLPCGISLSDCHQQEQDIEQDMDGLILIDNCPDTKNPSQQDHDADGIGDNCDPCLDNQVNLVDGNGNCYPSL